MKLISLLTILLVCFLGMPCKAQESELPAELKKRGSLVINTDFKLSTAGTPYCWGLEAESPDDVAYGKAGTGTVSFVSGRGTIALSQDGLKLKKGEKYRIGCWIRTKQFKAHKSGVLIHNYQWSKESKTPNFPEDTKGQWVLWEAEVECPMPGGLYSLDCTYYGFSIVAWDIKSGVLDVRNPYLVSMSPEAERHSSPAAPDISKMENAFLIPAFSAHNVQSSRPVFKFISQYDFSTMENDVHVTLHLILRNSKTQSWKAPLKNNQAEIRPGIKLPVGPAEIQVDLYVSGKRLRYQLFHVNIVEDDLPVNGKECNNLVTELFNGPMPAEGVSFHVNDWQWIHLSFPKLAEGDCVMLDGTPVKLFADGHSPEAMRYLARGSHTLKAPAGTAATLRMIPEIFIYPFSVAPKHQPEHCEFNADFFKKHIWHSMNMYNIPSTYISPETKMLFHEFEERGGRLLQCAGLNGDAYYDSYLALKELSYGTSHFYGQSIDEISAADTMGRNTAMANALWLLQDRQVPVYIWTVHGAPFKNRTTQLNLLSALANNAWGQGHVLAESYMTNYPCEEDLEARLNMEREYHRKMTEAFPEFPRLRIEVNSTYSTYLGLYMADAYPESDLKVALDRYWHMIATDPVYKGTYGVGNYALNHADEEMFRWLGAMFRHYFVEGNTTLLSAKHGFSFILRHIENGDFREGLSGWEPSGAITTETINGYGKNKQRRMVWSAFNFHKHPEYCDHVAVLKGHAKLSQTLAKLVPGKAYVLTYITAFRTSLTSTAKQRIKHPVSAQLTDVEILHEDNDNNRRSSPSFFRHRIIFRAGKSASRLTLKDTREDATDGGDILLNGIAVRPYFEN